MMVKPSKKVRRDRDSNPRYPFGAHSLSRRARSTTPASLRLERQAKYTAFIGSYQTFVLLITVYSGIVVPVQLPSVKKWVE
jgi:hypothetical protein